MKQLIKKAVSILALSSAMVGTANAAIIFEDNFDTENGGNGQLNYTGFTNWSVLSGAVDLIGTGTAWDWFAATNGLYIDLDGSTGTAGLMGHLETLSAGDYTLSFDLAGNQRNDAAETTTANVSIVIGSGTAANTNISLNRMDTFTTYSLDFSVLTDPSMIMVTFGAAGGDNIGMLLDNVVLQDRVSVPEPAALSLLAIGLLGVGLSRRKAA